MSQEDRHQAVEERFDQLLAKFENDYGACPKTLRARLLKRFKNLTMVRLFLKGPTILKSSGRLHEMPKASLRNRKCLAWPEDDSPDGKRVLKWMEG
jgi:hypothetical protein